MHSILILENWNKAINKANRIKFPTWCSLFFNFFPMAYQDFFNFYFLFKSVFCFSYNAKDNTHNTY